MPQTGSVDRAIARAIMKTFVRIALVIGTAALATPVPASVGRPAQATLRTAAPLVGGQTAVVEQPDDRVVVSFLLARGRVPNALEARQWTPQGPVVLADLMARHRRELQDDLGARQEVSAKAAIDALGVGTGDSRAGAAAGGAYVDVVGEHLRRLAAQQEEYVRVVRRAYRLVLGRDVYPSEIEYWTAKPVLPFALLAACIDDWGRRNQPGLTVTSGVPSASVNSGYLATVRLTAAVAAEARGVAGMDRPSSADTAAMRHVVAPGAGPVASVGGIHFAAAGAAGLGVR
jgi:hypothetical protein